MKKTIRAIKNQELKLELFDKKEIKQVIYIK